MTNFLLILIAVLIVTNRAWDLTKTRYADLYDMDIWAVGLFLLYFMGIMLFAVIVSLSLFGLYYTFSEFVLDAWENDPAG